MSIEIKLFGFGDERPAGFDRRNRLRLDIDTPATPRAVLRAIGIDDEAGGDSCPFREKRSAR